MIVEAELADDAVFHEIEEDVEEVECIGEEDEIEERKTFVLEGESRRIEEKNEEDHEDSEHVVNHCEHEHPSWLMAEASMRDAG